MAARKKKGDGRETIKKNSSPQAQPDADAFISDLNLIGALAQKFVSLLSEHADSVQIICTKLEPNGTTSMIHIGSGNVYARAQSMRSVLAKWESLEVI